MVKLRINDQDASFDLSDALGLMENKLRKKALKVAKKVVSKQKKLTDVFSY